MNRNFSLLQQFKELYGTVLCNTGVSPSLPLQKKQHAKKSRQILNRKGKLYTASKGEIIRESQKLSNSLKAIKILIYTHYTYR